MSYLSHFLRKKVIFSHLNFIKCKLCVQKNVVQQSNKRVGWWLASCACLSAGAIFLGGITRLTESGLSMTDWRLIKDLRLPRTEEAWDAEFQKYKEFPEWRFLNKDRNLTLSQFKFIYVMEYLHRMWGRAVGLAFFLPLTFFWYRGYFDRRNKFVMMGLGSLLCFQGFLGWFMVRSGLDENLLENQIPRVSQYRLAVHFAAAMLLYGGFFLTAINRLLHVLPSYSQAIPRSVCSSSYLIFSLISLTLLSGTFVSGLDAGRIYNSFPKMGNNWIPDEYLYKSPWWKNLFENEAAVQFNHRTLALLTFSAIIAYHVYTRRLILPRRVQLARVCLHAAGMFQVGLGIATLLLCAPVWLASLHQMGAVCLFTSGLWLANELKRLPKI